MNNCNEILSASSRDAILCVSPFDDLFKYYADKQFTKDSLEKVSMYVPDLSLLLPGDILTCTVKGRDVVGVITDVHGAGNAEFGSNQSEALNAVEFVWISTTKAEKTNWKDFSAAQKPKNVVFRRLLKYDGASSAAYTCAEWNVLDDMPYSARITIGKMREQDQKSEDRWRWIPNTGEYLVLEEISMEFTNKAGLKLPGTEANGYTVRLKGAYDRNYDADKADQGNIYNNAATAFSVAMLDGNDGVMGAYALGNTETVGGKKLYKIGEAKPLALTLTAGDVLRYNGAKARIGLRPESAKTARPGDDFILVFTVGYNTRTVDIALADADYVAVYDKKMLWRANLYIKETEVQDWNDAHPWNAPPDGVATANTPSWWSTDWGKNEWNRVYDGTQGKNKLADLGAGNGGQVVTFPEFTPLRTIPAGNEASPTSTNVITGTVAYSYPSHPKEDPDTDKGMAGSMDSPFDYVWKMMQQKQAIEESIAGTAGVPQVIVPVVALEHEWKNYMKGTSTKQRFIPSLGLFYGYPEHDTNEMPWHKNNTTNTVDDTLYWNWDTTFEAGTDCVGFAQRAASYANNYQWYKLPPGIMESGSTDYTVVQDGYTGSTVRAHVRAAQRGINSWNVINKGKEVDEPSTDLHKDQLLHAVPGDIWVKYPYPVAEQDTKIPGSDAYRNPTHIAIVAYVPPNAEELSTADLMNSIILIEGEFTNKIQSVIKKLNVGDYNNDKLTSARSIYPGID